VNSNLDSFYNKHAKRSCDAVAGAALLTATSPVLVACAVAIKLDDGGPVFFHQRRVGKGGQPFTVHKLRTMTVGTDQIDGGYPTPTMVTRVGGWVRRLSLNEIPQLWNITIGEMSFVGPRPTLPNQVARYTERQFHRLDVRPGLTGLAQIRFRNAAPWSVRIEADLEYVENTQSADRPESAAWHHSRSALRQRPVHRRDRGHDRRPRPRAFARHGMITEIGSEFEYPTHDQLDAGGQLTQWIGAGKQAVGGGRQALGLVAARLAAEGRRGVLVPDHHCESMTDPFTRHGLGVVTVPTTPDCLLDPDALDSTLTSPASLTGPGPATTRWWSIAPTLCWAPPVGTVTMKSGLSAQAVAHPRWGLGQRPRTDPDRRPCGRRVCQAAHPGRAHQT
jgi:lipopolysaccharide/colanic/teichoic acid biosynthesis glycosyltransferase